MSVPYSGMLRSVPEGPLAAFVHVYDRTGKLLAQHDGPLGQSGFPTNNIPLALWHAGDGIQDVHTVPLSTPLPADGYTVAVGLYDPATVQRLPARSPSGAALRDDLYVLER